MARNLNTTNPVDRKLVTLSSGQFTNVNVGISLTASVTAISVTGAGWFDFISLINGDSVLGFSNTDARVDVYVDGVKLITQTSTFTYYFNPVYGHVATDGTDIAYATPIQFREKMYVTVETTSAEDASFSARLAIHYGTV